MITQQSKLSQAEALADTPISRFKKDLPAENPSDWKLILIEDKACKGSREL
jgi:hypothetical protein